MLDKLTVDDFRPAVGQPFSLDLDGSGTVVLELVEAEAQRPGAPATGDDGVRTPFRLEFRGPADQVLPQRMYRLEHAATGALEIFIVPLGVSDAGARYEAIFA